MENKDIFLMIGLTVVVALIVSISTLSITGNVARMANADGTFTDAGALAEYSQVQQAVQLSHSDMLTTFKNAKIVDVSYSQGYGMNCMNLCSQQGVNGKQTSCVFGLFATKVMSSNLYSTGGAILVDCDTNKIVEKEEKLSCYCVEPVQQ